jgi:hypothetical protein
MDAIPLHHVPKQILVDAAKGISDFVIGFVRLCETRSEQKVELGGSGTLVHIDDSYGILTACHVLDHLRNADEIGLVLPTRCEPFLHSAKLKSQVVRPLKVAQGPVHSEGPDLGLLILAEADIGWLKAKKSFYNLPHHREQIVDNPLAHDEGVWFLCGFAGELTSEAPPEKGYALVKEFHGACGIVCVRREYQVGDFDYFELEAEYGGINEPPRSFGGFSGGGVWQVPLIRTPGGELQVKDLLLSGVAFYQFAPTNGHCIVKCHSRRSTYLHTIEAVRNAVS